MSEQTANSLFSSLLRILTIEEINDLTTTSSGREKIDLTEMIFQDMAGNYDFNNDSEGNLEDSNAKILPFQTKAIKNENNTEVIEIEDIPTITCGTRCQELLENWVYKFEEMEQNLLGIKRFAKKKSGIVQKEMSTFIIEEKKKFEQSYGKLKKVEVLDLYRKNASVDIEIQKANKDDLSKSNQSGVLINKKQA